MSAYSGLANRYDAFTCDVPYTEFADLYENIFVTRNKNPKLLLDLACGTGTLSSIMSKRGYDMIVADASADMLSEVMDKYCDMDDVPLPVMLCQQMQSLDLYGTVEACYCSLDGFNYLPGEDIPEVLRRLGLFIEKKGLLIFDVITRERFQELSGQIFSDERDDALCFWRADWHDDGGYISYGMDIFTKSGKLWKRDQEEHIEYGHTEEFLQNALTEAGFENIEIIRDSVQSQFGRIFIVAENSGKGMKI